MKLGCTTGKSGRQFMLLAPSQGASLPFQQALCDSTLHYRLLTQTQKLRGRIYLQDGAIQSSEPSADVRHIQAADDLAWHLLTVDEKEGVTACIRYLAHKPTVSFSDLSISRTGIARSAELGPRVREAIETELEDARRRGILYVELGGWAISESLRCSTEAIRTLLTVYALSQIQGGALGLSSATTRHHSSSILRRIGGRTLRANGIEVPAYYDPQYGCEMELLSFDSTAPNERYAVWIDDCRRLLHQVPVVACAASDTSTSDLLHLGAVVGGRSSRLTRQAELARV